MSRRLAQMTEESLEDGGRAAQKSVQDAGFSEELKARLEGKIAASAFKSENAAAISYTNISSSAGRGTQDIAAGVAWTGTESTHDTSLRMLNDASKPMRIPFKAPTPRGMPNSVDMRPKPKDGSTTGQRLANARDKSSIYAVTQDTTMSEKEREEMRRVLKERFTLGARPMPTTLQGLTSLANERIEDAIARGQFKNIPRGKGTNVERDHMANSPFLDTTEYFMNKIIQRQEIVPPWIEKQQELAKETDMFRKRLRNDWRRHAARIIASQGGTLEQQLHIAKGYAAAEARLDSKKIKAESVSALNSDGKITQITVEETPPSKEVQIQEAEASVAEDGASQSQIAIKVATVVESSSSTPQAEEESITITQKATDSECSTLETTSTPSTTPIPNLPPFRDTSWLNLESAYHNLALQSLNSLARSYNLMAPAIAQKPYYNLDRELASCYADVAPQIAREIEQRARAPPDRVRGERVGHRAGGIMERFGTEKAVVWDEKREKKYGFSEFWKDLWGEGK